MPESVPVIYTGQTFLPSRITGHLRAGGLFHFQEIDFADLNPTCIYPYLAARMYLLDALITNDAVVLGLLMALLGFIFYTTSSGNRFWVKFYRVVPSLLLCYFIPSLFNSTGIIDGEKSRLYPVISRYILPVSLVLFTISIDYAGIRKLGPKALVVFLAGSAGVVLGGPLAVLLFSWVAPDVVGGQGPEAVWRGLTCIAGSWIGGSANQAAMKEIFQVDDKLFSTMIAVDVLWANLWMAMLLYGAGISQKIDRFLKADATAIEELKARMEHVHASGMRIPSAADLMKILGIGFGVMGLSHFLADIIAPWIEKNAPGLEQFSLTTTFFWVVVLATTFGMLLALTPVRGLEGAGASKVGTVLLYVLVASVGMKMNILAVKENPSLFLLGAVWIFIHASVTLLVAKWIKAPFFFVAAGSQANVGGAASASIVASAFSPALAPVGVLLAVLGYALGTYGAYICGLMMQAVAP